MVWIIGCCLLLLVLSHAIGKIVSIKINLNEKLPYSIPLGFFIILGLYELITFPVMTWHLSSQILVILTVCLIGGLSIYALLNTKDWLKITFNFDWLVIIAMSAVLILFYMSFSSLNYTGEDFNFYIPFVGSNVNVDKVNWINPWNGDSSPVSWMYNFQSYYLLLSSISQITKIDYTLVTLWLPSILYFTIMPLCLFNVVAYFFKDMNRWLKYLVVFILFFVINDTLSSLIYPFYGNQFRPFIMIYMMFSYLAYQQSPNVYTNILLAILMFSHFSVQSTGLFIGGILVILLMIYEAFFATSKHLEGPFILSLPLAVYLVGIIHTISPILSGFALVMMLIGYLLVFYFFKRTSVMMLSLYRGLMVLIVGVIILGSIILTALGIDSPVSIQSFFPDYLSGITYFMSNEMIRLTSVLLPLKVIYVILTWGLVLGAILYKDGCEEYKFYRTIIAGTLLLFYNPIVAPFVSKYLTGVVYGRVTILIFSLITFTIGLKYYVELGKTKKSQIALIGIGLIVAGLTFAGNSLIQFQDYQLKFILRDTRYDLFYKMPYNLMVTLEELDAYKRDYYLEPDYRPTILSCDLRTRTLYEEGILAFDVVRLREFYENYDENPYDYRMFLYAIITDSHRYAKNDPGVFDDLERRLREFSIDFVILPLGGAPQLYDAFRSFSERAYINDEYVVYHLEYLPGSR